MKMVGRSDEAELNPLMVDYENRNQQHLVLLIHTIKCMQTNNNSCTLQHCHELKNVLIHMKNCNLGKSCELWQCSKSRQIINHWKTCKIEFCTVCLPLKISDVTCASGVFTQEQNTDLDNVEQRVSEDLRILLGKLRTS